MRSIQLVNAVARAYFEVWDGTTPVTGLADGTFTKLLAKDGVTSGITVTVTEIGSGRYFATFTPNANGTWHLLVKHATYAPKGWHESFDVTQVGPDVSTVLDLANAIDGFTPREAMKIFGAALAGKCTIVESPPGTFTITFRSMDDAADRILATGNLDEERTSVTLTP